MLNKLLVFKNNDFVKSMYFCSNLIFQKLPSYNPQLNFIPTISKHQL